MGDQGSSSYSVCLSVSRYKDTKTENNGTDQWWPPLSCFCLAAYNLNKTDRDIGLIFMESEIVFVVLFMS